MHNHQGIIRRVSWTDRIEIIRRSIGHVGAVARATPSYFRLAEAYFAKCRTSDLTCVTQLLLQAGFNAVRLTLSQRILPAHPTSPSLHTLENYLTNST